MSDATLRIQALGNCEKSGTLLFFVTVDDLRPPLRDSSSTHAGHIAYIGTLLFFVTVDDLRPPLRDSSSTHAGHIAYIGFSSVQRLPTKNKAYRNLKQRDPFTLFKLFVLIIFIVRDFLCFHLTDCKNLSKIYHVTKQSKSK